jgi:hypothetical protein
MTDATDSHWRESDTAVGGPRQGARLASTSPLSSAITTAWARSRAPISLNTRPTWVLTGASPTTSRSAISVSDLPVEISQSVPSVDR